MRILCVGYFGRGNLGDDLYLSLVVPRLASAGHEVSVLCRGPHPTPVDGDASRFSGESPATVLRAVGQADIVLYPGGSVLQSASSHRSLAYYLSVSNLAAGLRKPVSYLSQGFGPVTGRLWRHLTVETLRSARRFVARDEETARVLREEGLQNVEQAADWCWLAPTAREPRSPNSEIVVVPCARHLPPRNLLDADSLVVAVERHSASFIYAFGRRHRLRWTDATTLEGWNSVTSRARIVVSARYHALVLALMAGIPVVAVGTDPKIRSLALQFSLCWYPDYDALPRPLHQMAPPVPPSDKLIAVKLLAEKNEEYLKDVTARD